MRMRTNGTCRRCASNNDEVCHTIFVDGCIGTSRFDPCHLRLRILAGTRRTRWLDVGVPPRAVDAVAVLPGDENTRPFVAARC